MTGLCVKARLLQRKYLGHTDEGYGVAFRSARDFIVKPAAIWECECLRHDDGRERRRRVPPFPGNDDSAGTVVHVETSYILCHPKLGGCGRWRRPDAR